MLVFLLFHLGARVLQSLALGALEALGELADQLPVQMILRLRLDDAFGGDQLGRFLLAGVEGHLHGADQRFAHVRNHETPGSFRLRVETELLEQPFDDLHMRLCLLEVLLPFLLQLVIDNAPQRGLVYEDAALFRFERLIEEFCNLFLVPCHRAASLAEWLRWTTVGSSWSKGRAAGAGSSRRARIERGVAGADTKCLCRDE